MRRPHFSLLVLVLLFTELAAPLVWADGIHTPTPARIHYDGSPATGTTTNAGTTPATTGGTPSITTGGGTGTPATTTATTAASSTATSPTGTAPAASTTVQVNRPASASNAQQCTIHSMSKSEVDQLHNFLFSSAGAFSGDALSDLTNLQALANRANKPVDPFSAEAKKNQNPNNPNAVDLKTIIALGGGAGLSQDEINDWAKRNGFWDYQKNQLKNNGQITETQAKDILKGKGGTPTEQMLKQIQDLFGQATNSKAQQEKDKEATAQLEPYERYKIFLPGSGKPMSLADVFRANKIDPDSCVLKDTVINGRVGYIAILDSDLTYGTRNSQILKGAYVSSATGKPNPELVSERNGETLNQFVQASSLVGYLNLNGGGNLIVPEFYRDWIVFTYAYAKWDFYTSMVLSLASLGAIKNLEEVKKVKEKSIDNIRTREPDVLLQNSIRDTIVGEIERDAAGHQLVKTPFTIVPAGGLPGGRVQSFAIEEIPGGAKVLNYYNAPGAPPIKTVTGINSVEDAIKFDKSLTPKTSGGLVEELKEADYNLNNFKRIKSTLDSRVAASFMLAGGWLGPARMAFSLNNGILFQARNQQDDKFLRVLGGENRKVLADFKQASGFLALGKIQELVAQYAGLGLVPEKAFYAKKLLFLNYPEAQKTPNYESTTGFITQDDGTIAVKSRWRGPSYGVNYEDMRTFATKSGKETFTSLSFVSNNIIAEPALEDKNLHSLTSLFSLAIPYIVSRKIFELQERSLGAGVFLTTLEYLDINENIGKDVKCDREQYETFKSKYRLAFAGSVTVSLLSTLRTGIKPLHEWLRQASPTANAFAGFLNLLDYTNPPEAWRFYVGNQAIAYTSNCKDQMATILTWQPIPDKVSTTATGALDKLPAVGEQLSKLGLSQIIGANQNQTQAETQLKNLKEVLNLKAVTKDQGGFIRTPELLYVHIDQSTSAIKGDLYGLINSATSCPLPDGVIGKDGRQLTFSNGLVAYDQNGTAVLSFQDSIWKLRAMANNKVQSLARIIIPNTIIQTHLLGSSASFLEVAGSGQSTLVSAPCDLAGAVFDLTGRTIGTDFTQAIGKVRMVQTSEGEADFMDGQIDYVGRNGIGASAPTPEELRNAIKQGGRISIRNDGSVVLYGASGNTQQPIGTLTSVIGENGALYYNPPTQEISLIIYSIFDTSAQNIQSYTMDQKGKGVGIQVQAKRGQEDTANNLNKALDKIAGKDGITSFETKDHIYYITPDGKLRVIDKNTGKATDYNITGPISRDAAGNIVIPTDKGPFSFNVGNQNGQPTLTANGPDGLKEVLALLAARGQEGILTFNPSTGAINVYNGQDVPLNPAFADKGIGISGGPNGATTGVPADTPFLSPATGSGTSDNAPPKLFLPSVPDSLPWAALFAGMILIGVVAVRFRRIEN